MKHCEPPKKSGSFMQISTQIRGPDYVDFDSVLKSVEKNAGFQSKIDMMCPTGEKECVEHAKTSMLCGLLMRSKDAPTMVNPHDAMKHCEPPKKSRSFLQI